MKRITKIAMAAGAALTLGLAAATVSADPYGYGPGWHMGGYGPGYGMGPGGHMGGYGPGYGMGPGARGGYGPGYRGGWGMHGYGMGGYGMGPQAMFGFYGNTDESLDTLKEQLGITAQQDAAWQAFAKSAKQQSESRQAWFDKMQQARSARNTPEFLAQQSEFMKQRQAEVATNAAALKNLYAALTPEQRAIADQSFGGYGPGYCLQAFNGPRGRAR